MGKKIINIQRPTLQVQTQKWTNLMYKRKLPLGLRVMQKMVCQRMWNIQPLGLQTKWMKVQLKKKKKKMIIGTRVATPFLSVTENTSASLSW